MTCPVLLLAVGMMMPAAAPPPRLSSAAPESVGMEAARLAEIETIVQQGLRDKAMPGAVVLVARRGRIVHLRAFGHRQVQPDLLPMTLDTLFDLASLTKPIATATSIMKLVEMQRLELDDPVAKHLPEFAQNGKEHVTVLHLLTHQGGLTADNRLKDYEVGPANAWQKIWKLPLVAEPGTRFLYSDVGFLVLGELVRRISGMGLQDFARREIFEPLGMRDTGFLPPQPLRARAAPTQQREGRWMRGEVHDPRSYALGGVAGHAGLFSTAEDLAIFGQMLLGRGEYAGVRVLSTAAVEQMTRACEVPGGLRGLGWDIRTRYSTNRGNGFSPRAFGHGGFTGTAIWIDPDLQLLVIFLSNRVHPDGKGAVNALIGRIGTIAAAATRAGQ